jgi:hypothetical protein
MDWADKEFGSWLLSKVDAVLARQPNCRIGPGGHELVAEQWRPVRGVIRANNLVGVSRPWIQTVGESRRSSHRPGAAAGQLLGGDGTSSRHKDVQRDAVRKLLQRRHAGSSTEAASLQRSRSAPAVVVRVATVLIEDPVVRALRRAAGSPAG